MESEPLSPSRGAFDLFFVFACFPDSNSKPGPVFGGRMTGNKAKIWTGDEKPLVEVRRKNATTLDF